MRTGSILEKTWSDAKALLKHVETLGGFMKETRWYRKVLFHRFWGRNNHHPGLVKGRWISELDQPPNFEGELSFGCPLDCVHQRAAGWYAYLAVCKVPTQLNWFDWLNWIHLLVGHVHLLLKSLPWWLPAFYSCVLYARFFPPLLLVISYRFSKSLGSPGWSGNGPKSTQDSACKSHHVCAC